MTIKEMQAEYQTLVEQARAEKAKHEGKDMPADARSKIDELLEAAMAKKDAIEAEVKRAETDAKWAEINQFNTESAGRLPGMSAPAEKSGMRPVEFKDHKGVVREYVPTGTKLWPAPDEVKYTAVFRKWLGGEKLTADESQLAERKALSMGSDIAGGFLVPSEVFIAELVQGLGNEVFMRSAGRVLPTLQPGASVSVPAADSELDAAEWTVESGTGTADTATPFAKRTLTPHPLVKLVKASASLIRQSAINVEAYVRDQIMYKFAIAEENTFLNGTGAGQPEGVFTTTNATVTAADVTCTGATDPANDIAYDDLVAVEFALKSQYRRNASWIIGRTVLKELHLLTDGIGRPLLRTDPVGPARFSLLGYPVNESEYAPSTSTTGLYVAALGDWRRSYWIVDSLNFELQRLVELYAASNQIGYKARRETDGMIVDGNGLIRLKMG